MPIAIPGSISTSILRPASRPATCSVRRCGSEGELIGAFEVINRVDGPFTDEDEETLVQLGVPAAIALQNAQEREHMAAASSN